MKFVIKSLLFVNLILQMTGSLRKCFDHDESLMFTIILLAFSLIGIIGLTIGNRFILIVFAACMTLILIASITIYAINRTELAADRPKVPYFVSQPFSGGEDSLRKQESPAPAAGFSQQAFVNKLLNRNQPPALAIDIPGGARRKLAASQTTTAPTNLAGGGTARDRADPSRTGSGSPVHLNARRSHQQQQLRARTSGQQQQAVVVVPVSTLDDYTEIMEPSVVPVARSLAKSSLPANSSSRQAFGGARNSNKADSIRPTPATIGSRAPPPARPVDPLEPAAVQDGSDGQAAVESELWVAYERRIYEKYLKIVSQSIDLVLHSILASWMALLLDEDSDQCFGAAGNDRQQHRSSSSGSSTRPGGASLKRRRRSSLGQNVEAPVCNYNGIRYSIRPETSDSPGGFR